jgi:hypothetical protein
MDSEVPTKRKKDSSKEKSAKKDQKDKKSRKIKSIVNSVTPTEPDIPIPVSEKSQKRKRQGKDEKAKTSKKVKKETKPKSETEELEIDISAPTPPSKKALRLQKKGKPIPRLPSTSQPPPSTSAVLDTTDAGDADTTHPDRKKLVREIPRAEFSVWIGNLSYRSDVKGLRGWLVRGEKRVRDKDITRMNLPLNAQEQSKGYSFSWGYVDVGLHMWIWRPRRRWRGLLNGVRRLLMGGNC